MTTSLIVVHPKFDACWPFAADRIHEVWRAQGPVEFIRLPLGDDRSLGEVAPQPAHVHRLVALGVRVTPACLARFTQLREAAFDPAWEESVPGVTVHQPASEGFWGQSVAEFALALTLCGLRRIPQLHHAIHTSHAPWDYSNVGLPGQRGGQFGDDLRFTNGTLAGKRVRIAGLGNIGSRYASWCAMLGADVAAWDPVASEPVFHRTGTRRERDLDGLVRDAEIFAPMMPLREKTRGVVTAEHIRQLPRGCLVVLVTRAEICNMPELRRRVLADELSLAADVFDVEPLPLNDPLLGRPNVIHTPHNAGRTIHANYEFAAALIEEFTPRKDGLPATPFQHPAVEFGSKP